MRKIPFLILMTVALCFGQNISVLGREEIPIDKNYDFSSPKFSPDGSKILFTQSGFTGLWIYNLDEKSLTQLNSYRGAGYEPVFSSDGSQVFFRVDNYENFRRYSKIVSQDVSDKKEKVLVEESRNLLPIRCFGNEKLAYVKQNNLIINDLKQNRSLEKALPEEPVVYIENSKIALVDNNGKRILAPLGDGNYIWPSLSPDNSKILFTLAGSGTYISDLQGNVITELGYANAPKWSPDGKWIVYMVDEDDGHRITASDIWASSYDGKTKVQLTNTDDIIEMNPDWSPKMDKIVFNTISGKIVILNIRVD